MKLNILLRGDICRGCTTHIQIDTYKSIIKHVIGPLRKNCNDINIIIVTYKDADTGFIKELFGKFNCFFFEIRRSTQVNGFVASLNIILEHNLLEQCEGIIVLRSDLYFIQDLDYTRKKNDNILFQWNLLHQKSTGEMADQIHFIGGDLVYEFINKVNKFQIDTKWSGTLHNLYNFCKIHFGKENISYMNYIEDPIHNKDICDIRGNPMVRLGNPLYNYTRYVDSILRRNKE